MNLSRLRRIALIVRAAEAFIQRQLNASKNGGLNMNAETYKEVQELGRMTVAEL